MKIWMTTAAAIALLAGVSVANAQNAPASSDQDNAAMEQSSAPKVKSSTHKTRVHHAMRMHRRTSETTGAGGRVGPIGSGHNDPSIHQSVGDRDSRGYPKQH